VAHFSARLSSALAIEMEKESRLAQKKFPVRFAIFPEITEEIDHDSRGAQFHRAKRETADSTDMLRKLTGERRFERVMA